jgi:hypothetical protein
MNATLWAAVFPKLCNRGIFFQDETFYIEKVTMSVNRMVSWICERHTYRNANLVLQNLYRHFLKQVWQSTWPSVLLKSVRLKCALYSWCNHMMWALPVIDAPAHSWCVIEMLLDCTCSVNSWHQFVKKGNSEAKPDKQHTQSFPKVPSLSLWLQAVNPKTFNVTSERQKKTVTDRKIADQNDRFMKHVCRRSKYLPSW